MTKQRRPTGVGQASAAAAFEGAPFAAALYRADGALAYANPAFRHVLGLAAPAHYGHWLACKEAACGLSAFWRKGQAAFEGARVAGEAFTHGHGAASGGCAYQGSAYPLAAAEGGIAYVVVTCTLANGAATPATSNGLATPEDARYRRIVESSQAGIWTQDATGRVTYANPRMGEILDTTPDRLVGKFWYDFVPPHAQDVVKEQRRRRKAGHSDSYELEYRRVDGRPVWAHISAIPLQDGPGAPVGSMAIITDITEQRRAEAALRSIESRYRGLVENSIQGVFVLDAEERVAYANAPAAAISGTTPAEMLGRPLADFIHPDERAHVAKRMAKRREGITESYTRRTTRMDGSPMWLHITSIPHMDAENRYQGSTVFTLDLTEQLRVKEALTESEGRYQRIVENSQEGIWTVDLEGRVTFANVRMAELLGIDRTVIVGRAATDFIPPESIPLALAQRARRHQGISDTYENQWQRADGTPLWVRISSAPITAPDGTVTGSLAMVSDVTQQVRAEHGLAESEARYRRIVEHSLEGIYTMDAEDRISFVNPRAAQMLGIDPARIIGTSILDLVHPEELEHSRQQLDKRHRGIAESHDRRYRRSDGSTLTVQVSAVPHMDAAGTYLGTTVMMADLTQRLQMEDALRQSEASYRRIVEHTLEGIAAYDANDIITFVNGRLADLLGTPVEVLIGKNILELLAPEDQGDAASKLRDRRRGVAEVFDRNLVKADGTRVPVHVSAVPDIGPDGSYRGTVAMLFDLTSLRQSEHALRESEARYRRIVEYSLEGILTLDPEFRISFANQSAAQMFGLSPQALIGRPILDFVPVEERADALERQKRRRTGVAERLDRRYVRDDGTDFHVHIASAPIFDEAGVVTGAINLMTDITPRVAAERSLRESEERYRRIVENSQEGIWTLDREARITFANRRMADMLGTTPEALIGRSGWDFMPEGSRDAIAQRAERRREGIGDTYEHEFQRDDGSRIAIQVSAVPVLNAAGEYQGTIAMVTDLSEREKAKDAERQANARYRLIVENSFEGIWTRDADSRVTFANKRMGEILGVLPEALVGRNVKEFLFPEDLEDFEKHLATRRSGHVELFDRRYRRLDGNTMWCQVSAVPIVDEAGVYHGSTDMVVDVTARRQLERQFMQSQKMEAVGRMAGGVAHDFNNMLTVVLGYTHLLMASLGAGHPQRQTVEEIRKAANRSASLARRLLAFSRHQQMEVRSIVLSDLVTDMLPMLKQVLPESIVLTPRLALPLAAVLADPGQIEQVVMNLTINARDAMPNGGALTIEVAEEALDAAYASMHLNVAPGRYVRVAVTDTGTGMSAATREHLFEPFFTTKEPGKGTGLGLSTVYGIVRNSHGHISVQSELGRGSTFLIYLPVTDTAGDAPASTSPAGAAGGSECVLLVEDEESVRTLVRIILESAGYRVLAAKDAAEALALCNRHAAEIDLLLADVVMPQMGGFELAEQVQEHIPHVKCIFMSGYSPDQVAGGRTMPAGANFLQKPILPDALRERVRQTLDF